MSSREHSPDLGVGTSASGGRARDEGNQSPRTPQKKKNSLFEEDPSFYQDDDDLDVKPLIRDGPFGAGGFQSKPKNLGVIDLCDESDGETPPPPPARKGASQQTLAAVRAVVPDVDPRWLIALAKQPRHQNGDANAIVNELLAQNYRLRDGSFKYGDPDEGVKKKKGTERAREESEQEEEEFEEEEEDSETEARKTRLAAVKKEGSNKGKAKAPTTPKKGKKRVAPSDDDDEDEEEIDQLASDQEEEVQEESEEEDLPPLSKADAFKLKEHYLDVDERSPGNDKYEKAALDQLYRDFDQYAISHIKQIFASDQCLEFYAPTWVELNNLRKMGLLNKLHTTRDMDKPIRCADGKEHARPKVPKSSLFAKEKHWLESYLLHKGKFDQPVGGKKYKPAGSPKQKKKAKADNDDRRSVKKKQAANRSELKNGWRGEKSRPKQKKQRYDDSGYANPSEYGYDDLAEDFDLDGADDCEREGMLEEMRAERAKPRRATYDGGFRNRAQREESTVDAFSGRGRRLGD